MTKEQINPEHYNSIKNLLRSPDKESQIMGLSCLNNFSLINSEYYVSLLIMVGRCKNQDWFENANEHYTYATKKICYVGAQMSFEVIFRRALTDKVHLDMMSLILKENIQYLNRFVALRYNLSDYDMNDYLTQKINGQTTESIQSIENTDAGGTVLRDVSNNA